MAKKKINETASAGATSAGAIATNASGFNFPLNKRLPPTNLFGYTEYDIDKETKKKKR